MTPKLSAALLLMLAAIATKPAHSVPIREVQYDPRGVIQVSVARGVALLIELPDDDVIRYVAVGRASDCSKAEDNWCVSTPAESHLIFAKAKSRASGTNNLEVVSAPGRKYSFRLVIVDERDATQRLIVRGTGRVSEVAMLSPPPVSPRFEEPIAGRSAPARATLAPRTPSADAQQIVNERLAAGPRIVNSEYSLALGERSEDIVPSAVFDDALFTYLRIPGNREIPAVFQVTADGQETLTNTRMEGDFLVVDRVSRVMRLRVGLQVVSIINEAFDIEGRSVTKAGVTVDGLERVLKGKPEL